MNYETQISSESPGTYTSDMDLSGEARNGTRRKWLIAAAILIAAVLGLAAFFAFTDSGAPVAAGDDRSQLPAVTVISPGTATIEGTIEAPGTIAARRELPVGVVGEGGRVASVPVDAGAWVRKGQVLAVIDRSVQVQQAAALGASLDVARADASLAQANLDRALQLVERGFVSKADVDRLTATRDAAAARVNVAQAQLREIRARNARLNIVAPESGLLLERNVEPGATVSPGSGALFRIAKGGEMELLAKVSEDQLAKLAVGIQASVVPAGSEQVFSGQVWQISPTINPQDRQGVARVALSYAPELRPGGFATATINSGTLVAPMLPESAVLSDKDGSYVFVIDKDDKADRRAVETGLITSKGIAITSGLTGSERVVLRSGGFLTQGETVNPVKREGGSS